MNGRCKIIKTKETRNLASQAASVERETEVGGPCQFSSVLMKGLCPEMLTPFISP